MSVIDEVAENIYLIDNELYSIPRWGGIYLINEERKVLIDSGPTTVAATVLDGIEKVGVRPQDIDYIVATHIHVDHSGGTGFLLRQMPKAKVVVHHRGARHLINPERLLRSMVAVQGEEALAQNGEVVPVAEERIEQVYGGEVIRLGERQVLKFFDASGHSPHNIFVQESRNNGVFLGDAVGVYVPVDGGVVLPSSPPPSFNMEKCLHTIDVLMKLGAAKLYFAHFGATERVQQSLQMAIDQLKAWDEMIVEAMEEGGADGVLEKVRARLLLEAEPIKHIKAQYEHVVDETIPVSVRGILKYHQDKHKAELDKRRQGEGN
ncbi:MBL fold metallo-hydrolase [Chloroflexota bacterium]